jgi:hypothetical protein
MIATKADIKALAFGNNFDINAVKDNVITLVEWEQVLPILGSDLFDDVVANPNNYTTLVSDYLKPYIAWSLKYYIIKGNAIKTGNKGSMTANGSNEQPADSEADKRNASAFAQSYKRQLIKELKRGYDAGIYQLWVEYKASDFINRIIIM